MIPTSPPLCFCSVRVKATAAGEAPAFDIWLMKHSAKLGGWAALSQALCAVARKVDGICQTLAMVIFPVEAAAPLCAAGGFWAQPKEAVASRAASNKESFMRSGSFAVPV